MSSDIEAYLDIETTGLSPTECMVTVVGIYTCNGEDKSTIDNDSFLMTMLLTLDIG